MAIRFSETLEKMKESDLGPLLKLTEQPDIISFAGGLPAPQTFPLKELTEVAVKVREKDGVGAMQYGPSLGYAGLRKAIADRMNRLYDTHVSQDDIIITSGSQQGLDICGRIFLDKDDVVLIESPSYLGAINAFALQQPRFVEVPTDEKGMIPEELDRILSSTPRVKMIYVIPNYQNPTGITWPLERRRQFMEVVNRHEIPVIEDNPYGDLRYEGNEVAPMKSMDPKDLVIYTGTFSKTLAPGMRLAWMVANPVILAKMDAVKQSTDLSTSCVSQREVALYMTEYDFEGHIKENCRLYAHRRDVMCNAMKKYFPESVHFTYPHGGLFTWVELPETMNARDLMKDCIDHKVAFVPGDSFFPTSGKKNYFRLNFSNCDDERLEEGIKRIADVIKRHM